MTDDWAFTQEPVRGHLFVGAITNEMVERAAWALRESSGALVPLNRYRKMARIALEAALLDALRERTTPDE